MRMGGEMKRAKRSEAEEVGAGELTWEKLLKRAPVSVLLVERDDSTSQIITALLRKCGYRVIVASDGMMAWVIMREKDHNIDLVLTEVELPKMSGVALLTMMMAHENCKHTPVIMMSSNDSISIAFKCMIKGASDFLVKPIRKNELINLWQHVWRKQKSENCSIPEGLDFDDNYHLIENATDKQDVRDCSEKESDAQSSCTRSEMEVESTCTLQNKMELKQAQHENFDESINPDKHYAQQLDEMSLFPNDETTGFVSTGGDIQPEVFDPTEVINYQRHHISITENSSDESTNELVDVDLEKKTTSTPSLQLSLKRYPYIISNRKESDESNTLHHSDFSAFSLYTNRSKVVPTSSEPSNLQSQNRGSCSTCTELLPPYQFAAKPLHYDNGLIFDAEDANLMDFAALPKQEGTTFRCTPIRFVPFPVPVGGISFDAAGSDPFLQPKFCQLSAQCPWSNVPQAFIDNLPFPSAFMNDFKSTQNHPQECSLQSQNIQSRNHLGRVEDAELVTGDNASACNVSRYHLSGGGMTDICNKGNAEPVTGTFDILEACARSGDQDGLQTPGLIKSADADAHRSSQREAALIKFRLKRKERCFEKKVRYLSRKKLAEQRPRVKGQFVRQL